MESQIDKLIERWGNELDAWSKVVEITSMESTKKRAEIKIETVRAFIHDLNILKEEIEDGQNHKAKRKI